MRFADCKIFKPEPLGPASTCADAVEFFEKNPDINICPIVNVRREPVGHLPRTAFQTKMTSAFGLALFGKRSAASMGIVMRGAVDVETAIADRVIYDLTWLDEAVTEGVVVASGGRYEGVISGVELIRVISRANARLVESLRTEVEERRRAEARIQALADAEPLTGLLNRRAFLGAVADRIDAGGAFACALMDLDRFKQINDQFGHAVGDALLETIADRLRGEPAVASPARFGGDEFAFLLEKPAGDEPTTEQLSRIREALVAPIQIDVGLIGCGRVHRLRRIRRGRPRPQRAPAIGRPGDVPRQVQGRRRGPLQRGAGYFGPHRFRASAEAERRDRAPRD